MVELRFELRLQRSSNHRISFLFARKSAWASVWASAQAIKKTNAAKITIFAMGRGWASPWASVQPKLKSAVLNAKTKAQMLRNSFLAMERGWASAWALVLTEAQITGFVIICNGNSLGFGLSFGSSDKTKAQMLQTSHFLQWKEVAPRLELRFNRSSNQRICCYL